ncbi:TIGR04325 family methyltransferase [Aliinostoc sp. HNIBRCY26]|uniref:TIGR04325 family methyltransferase n=1 Tax=Aliinostoc sp. HNIBRCY26 TaxID=3418997 RepID=UPI003CFFFA10
MTVAKVEFNKKSLNFKSLIKQIPIISDLFRYYWSFYRTKTACRGIYPSFADALKATPKGAKSGYNQPEISKNITKAAKMTTAWEPGQFNPQDYPILVWLASAFTQSSTVFDLGGNVGHSYYTYKKFVQYPTGLNWLVCEIPEVVKVGRELASQGHNPGLSFTTEFAQSENTEILITCGTLQYIEPSLADMIGKLQTKPRHILINQVPFYDGETFITLQNIGYAFCPYKIQNRSEFVESLSALGYELIDNWKLDRSCSIPFHPERFVRNYEGFYLKLKR